MIKWIPITEQFPPPDEEYLFTIRTLADADMDDNENIVIHYMNEVCVGSCETTEDSYDENVKNGDLRLWRYAYDFEDEWKTCDVTDIVLAWAKIPEPYDDGRKSTEP